MLGDPVGGLIARSHRLSADRRNTNYASGLGASRAALSR